MPRCPRASVPVHAAFRRGRCAEMLAVRLPVARPLTVREGSVTVVILGGAQTDFAVHHSREGRGLLEMMDEAVRGALADAGLEPGDVQAAHVGNFTGELFAGQGHLGGLFAALDPAFDGVPATRHEAACASGSMAVL